MGFEKEPSVAWAKNLKSLDELLLNKRAKNYLSEKYGTLDEIVLVGRKAAHSKDGKFPKAVIELGEALKTAGYVRADLDSSAFCVNRLYFAVFRDDVIDTKIYPCYMGEVESNDVYESFRVPTEEERRKLLDSMSYLTAHTRAILEYRFGFTKDGSHTLDEVAERFMISFTHAVEVEDQALRKIRAHKDQLPHLLPTTEEQEDEVDDIIDELERLYNEPIYAKACQLRNKLQKIAKLPFTCANDARIYLMDGILDDTPVDAIDLPVRTYTRLKRAGINTVAQIMRKARKNWNDIPAINQSDREAIMAALERLGYKLN